MLALLSTLATLASDVVHDHAPRFAASAISRLDDGYASLRAVPVVARLDDAFAMTLANASSRLGTSYDALQLIVLHAALVFALERAVGAASFRFFPANARSRRSLRELLMHAYLSALGVWAVWQLGAATLFNARAYWPHEGFWVWEGVPATMPWRVAHIYAAQGTYYGLGFIELLLVDRTAPDRWRLLAHHVTTLALIVSSARSPSGHWLVGVAIMLACDPNDVFMHATKLCVHEGAPRLFCYASLFLFVASWVAQRLYWLCYLILAPPVLFGAPMPAYSEPWGRAMPAALLFFILSWTIDIARVIWRAASRGKIEDVRDDEN